MFKNRKSALLAKKSSDLVTIIESASSASGPSQPKQSRAANDEPMDELFADSQFSVPASQMNSQRRYLSQRSNLQKSQSARTSRRMPTNYFESILLKCQVELDDPLSIVLRCEPLVFMRQLRTLLRGSADFPRNVKDFVNGVDQASRNKESFRKLLECCMLQNQTTQTVKPIQESLMKMLLCVDFMQQELITVLFSYVERESQETSGVDIIGLALSQIKFIDHTVHGTFVFKKYFEMLERSSNRQLLAEAIVSLQDVIDVTMHDTAFHKILELFQRADDLFSVTNVTVFSEMCLSNATLRLTRQKIVDFIESGSPVGNYPPLVKFLLKFNNVDADGYFENIEQIRHVIEKLLQLCDSDSNGTYLQEIFRTIQQALTVSAVLYEAWIKFCRLLVDEESHSPIDLLVLLLMLKVNEIRSGTIQKMLINKIKKRHITIMHMKGLTKQFQSVLTDHVDGVLEFVELCLKEKQTEVCEFGIMSMGCLISADSMNNRLVLNKLVGFMSEMALINEGRKNDHMIAVCMDALSNIHQSFPNETRNNAHVLLKIMDISTDLSLQQYRTVIDLICEAITVPNSPIECSDTWDDINIVIKKQLLSNNKEVKKKGIVGVVCLIYHMLRNSAGHTELNCSFDSEKTIESASEIPTAAGREIGNMINMMLLSSNESTDILALCYDEIAEMLQEFERGVGKPEKGFSVWMCDVITNEFQNYFIIEEVPAGDPVHYAKKLCINDTMDPENTNTEAYAIAVNIAENMLAYNSRYSSMCFFLAMFKLMKTLQSIRYNGNLESINALLGCSIVVPAFYDEPDEKTMLETFEEDVCRQLLDVYFYVANWFRELINAFIQQKDPLLHRKVLQRLFALVSLENRLAGLLKAADFDYFPPICDFCVNVQTKSSRSVKESSSKQNVTLNVTKTQPDAGGKSRTREATDFDTETVLARHRQGFRTIEGHVMKLFSEPLLLVLKLPEDKIGVSLSLAEYRFLLEIFVTGLESKTNKRSLQQTCNYELSELLSFLPNVVENYKKIKLKRLELKSSTTESDSQHQLNALNCCFNWTLRLFTAILQLAKTQQSKLLQTALQHLKKLIDSPSSKHDSENAIEEIIATELTHKNAFKNLFSACCLYKFGVALNNAASSTSNNASVTIATFCQKFLCTDFNLRSGTAIQLCLLLQGLTSIADFLKIKQVTMALAEDLAAGKNDERHFVGLQRSHYPVLLKELFKAFIKCIQTGLRVNKTTVQKFVLWEQSCEILKQFSEVTKQADNPKMYACYMRYSHSYLKLFQQTGLKVLEDVLKVSADRVSHLLSTLQHSTRYLHNICCHSKNVKDNSLTSQIPFIRETVEILIYSVKAVLAANDCSSVFWMGNLKNKDLKGELLLSQGSEIEDITESAESDVEDFLSEDESSENQKGSLRRADSRDKTSQSKCF
ncbi:Fanconi anemia group D2 protein homolog [Malaya genurostris]|uniref:Fanconi anemia group D2 protein homolog n=1 Tax=Malaya genurostris TaxID=325434 RepID=UPI0026F38057|nr:Fanconi anemia group D2 protein homolog [Malaya genurostris]